MESSAIFRFDVVNGVLSQVSLKNYFSGLFNTKFTCSMLNLHKNPTIYMNFP